MNYCAKCSAVNQIDVKYAIDVLPDGQGGIDTSNEYLQKRCRICGYLWKEPCADAKEVADSTVKKKEHILD